MHPSAHIHNIVSRGRAARPCAGTEPRDGGGRIPCHPIHCFALLCCASWSCAGTESGAAIPSSSRTGTIIFRVDECQGVWGLSTMTVFLLHSSMVRGMFVVCTYLHKVVRLVSFCFISNTKHYPSPSTNSHLDNFYSSSICRPATDSDLSRDLILVRALGPSPSLFNASSRWAQLARISFPP